METIKTVAVCSSKADGTMGKQSLGSRDRIFVCINGMVLNFCSNVQRFFFSFLLHLHTLSTRPGITVLVDWA